MNKIKEKIDTIWCKVSELIGSPETLKEARKEPQYFTRKRGMSFEEHLAFLINKGNTSTQTELNRFFEQNKPEKIPISEEAYSKARNHYDESPFVKLFDLTVKESYAEGSCITKKHQGLHVFAADGSTLALPSGNPEELCKAFGEIKGAPTARISGVFDVVSERIVAAEIADIHTGERALAKLHIDKICQLGITDVLFLFDRGYPSAEMFDYVEEKGYKYLMRVPKTFNLKIDKFKGGICYTKIGGKYRSVIKLRLESGEIENLVTNLSTAGRSVSFFKELYFMRWGVETNFGTLKQKIQVEAFSGLTETSIRQDFWASLFLQNMALIEKFNSDIEIKARAKETNIYEQKTNVSELIGSLKNRLVRIVLSDDDEYKKNPFCD